MQIEENNPPADRNSAPIDIKKELKWALAVFLMPLVLFFPRYFGPMMISDNLLELQPHYDFIFGMIGHLKDPLWNPYIFSGFPIAAYPTATPYQILAWPHLFFGPVAAANIHLLLLYMFAGAGFYVFARTMGIGRYGAFLAGLINGCGGTNLMSFPSAFGYGGMAWVGWTLAALEMLRRARGFKNRARWTILFALISSVEFMAGHPQIYLHTMVFAGLYTLLAGIEGETGKARWAWMLCVIVGVCLVPLLSAAVILPGWELQQLSWRKTIDYTFFLGDCVTFTEFIATTVFVRGDGNGSYTAFIGAVPFLLACYGAVKSIKDARHKSIIFIGLLSALMMMGDSTPLSSWIFHIPLMKLVSGGVRYGLEFTAACAILSGYGLDHLLNGGAFQAKKWWTALAILCISIAAIILFKNLGMFSATLVGIAAAMVAMAALHFSIAKKNRALLAIAVIAFLMEPRSYASLLLGTKENLVDVSVPSPILKYIEAGDDKSAMPPPRVLTLIDLAQFTHQFDYRIGAHNLSEYYRIHNASGYNPLMLGRYNDLVNMDFIGFPKNFRKLIDPPGIIPDILNIKSFVVPKRLMQDPKDFGVRLWTFAQIVTFKNIPFMQEMYIKLAPGEKLTFKIPEKIYSGMAIITAIKDGAGVAQDENVLKVDIASGNTIVAGTSLKAGIDTAEAAHDLFAEKTLVYENIPFYKPLYAVLDKTRNLKTDIFFRTSDAKASGVAIVSAIFNGPSIPQGEEIAKLILYDKTGAAYSYPIRAGIEASDINFDMYPQVAHSKVKVASTIESEGGQKGNIYFAYLNFENAFEPDHGEIVLNPAAHQDGFLITHITLIGENGKFIPGMAQMPVQHSVAPIFDKPTRDVTNRHYYKIAHFDKPVKADTMSLEALQTVGDIHISAITMLTPNPADNTLLTYVDYLLGNVRFFDREETPDAYIYHKKYYTPRAWLTSNAVWLDSSQVLTTLQDGKFPDGAPFNPWATALLEREQTQEILYGGNLRGGVAFEHYSENEIRLRASSDRRCVLILSEIYYPGWEATVDGEVVEVYRADYVLRGILMEAGDHEIVFKFRPKSVYIGRVVSLVSFLFLMATLAIISRMKR